MPRSKYEDDLARYLNPPKYIKSSGWSNQPFEEQQKDEWRWRQSKASPLLTNLPEEDAKQFGLLKPGEYVAYGTWPSGKSSPIVSNVPETDERFGQMMPRGQPLDMTKVGPVESFPDTEQRPSTPPQIGPTIGYPDVLARWRTTGEDRGINPAGTATAGQVIRRRFIQSNPNAVSPAERAQVQAQIAQEAASVAPKKEPEGEIITIDGKTYIRDKNGILREDKYGLAAQSTEAKAAAAATSDAAKMARLDKVLASKEGITTVQSKAAMDRVMAQVKGDMDLAKAQGKVVGSDEYAQKINDAIRVSIAEADKRGDIKTSNELKILQWKLQNPEVTTTEVLETSPTTGNPTKIQQTKGRESALTDENQDGVIDQKDAEIKHWNRVLVEGVLDSGRALTEDDAKKIRSRLQTLKAVKPVEKPGAK